MLRTDLKDLLMHPEIQALKDQFYEKGIDTKPVIEKAVKRILDDPDMTKPKALVVIYDTLKSALEPTWYEKLIFNIKTFFK